ncbi:MAG: exonuclease subunit SbcD [Streptosporangiales bacterium]|nr:exonuclease subunit SbcD [Streptosporangiales bacterium]
MRVLHTSDWHLGRTFHREDMLGAQARFVDHLVETVRAEEVDLVVVAGDVYDRALPPVDAIALYDEAMKRLLGTGTKLALISGNHDSAVRLGVNQGVLDAAGLFVRTDPARVGEPVLLEDAHGPVAVYGIPYLEPELVREPWELDERSHTAALGHAMDRIRTDQARRRPGTRSVVLSHAFVSGAECSDSERDIAVGGVPHVPLSTFDGPDYVALGHVHGRQTMAEAVRYSGSPLAYSFSETDHRKGGWLVELGPDGLKSADFLDAPVPRRLGKLRGRLDDLLTDPRHARHEDRWLQVTLTDPLRPRDAMERLRTRFPHALVLGFEPEGGGDTDRRSWAERTKGRSESELALDFVAWARDEPADPAERALLHEAFEAVRRREASA